MIEKELPQLEYELDCFYFGICAVELAGLESGKLASGLPKYTKPMRVRDLPRIQEDLKQNAEKRSKLLAQATPGSGHDCWFKSPTVFGYLIAEQAFIQQFSRYTSSMEFVSSQSTMVLLVETPLEELAQTLPKFCLGASIEEIQRSYRLIRKYREVRTEGDSKKTDIAFLEAKTALPKCTLGIRFKVNYMTLKTIYHQRKTHKSLEWRLFIEWMLRLPSFGELLLEGS